MADDYEESSLSANILMEDSCVYDLYLKKKRVKKNEER